MALLEIGHLSFLVPARPVLEDVSMTVEAGEIHALVGTNGTGKSILAHCFFPNAERVEHVMNAEIEAGEEAVVELTTRVFGHATDTLRIRERLVLAGRAARGLIKTRVDLIVGGLLGQPGMESGGIVQFRERVAA